MTTTFKCPACQKLLKLAKAIPAGKLIKCPKCAKAVRVPAVETEELLEESVMDKARPPPKKQPEPKKPARTLVREDDEEEETPRLKKSRAPVKTGLALSRHRDEEDDEEEDRPRKRKAGKKSPSREGNSGLVRNLIGAGVLLVLLVVLGVVAVMRWDVFFPPSKGDSETKEKKQAAGDKIAGRDKQKKPGGNAVKIELLNASLSNQPGDPPSAVWKLSYRFVKGAAPQDSMKYLLKLDMGYGERFGTMVDGNSMQRDGVWTNIVVYQPAKVKSTFKFWVEQVPIKGQGGIQISNLLEVPFNMEGGKDTTGPVLVVTNKQLIDEAKANLAGTYQKYNGKLVEISGNVNGVSFRRDTEKPILFFQGGQAGKDILHNLLQLGGQCVFATHDERILHLSYGQSVKIRGIVESVASKPYLKDCKLLELGPDPAVSLNSVQFTKEDAENNSATVKKYHGKAVRITGVIASVNAEPKFNRYTYSLAGFDEKNPAPPRVLVTLGNLGLKKYDEQIANLKVGMTIRVQGVGNVSADNFRWISVMNAVFLNREDKAKGQ